MNNKDPQSIHIVALGSECPGGLGYLGQGALVGPCDLESSMHNPAFMEYTSRVFGDVTVVVRDCPSWVRDWWCSNSTALCPCFLGCFFSPA
uniref:Rho related BTB domain containing 3 n=1 Tax=Cyclopterus lumpus TaxID=8103 RepID=A0A8C3A5B8_CYCLU